MHKIIPLFFISVGLALPSLAQIRMSDYTNNASLLTNKTHAVTVVNGTTNGYQSKAGGIFNHYGPAAATLTVNGTYDAYSATPGNPGVDNFNGVDGAQATAAEIAGNTAPLFGILNLNNGSNPVTISNTAGMDIGSTLAFANGITTTVRANAATGAIRFGNAAGYTATNTGNAQYVNGYVGKTGNTAFTFPVGAQSGTAYYPLSMSAPANAATSVAVAYWQGDPGTALDPTGGAHDRSAKSATPVNGETLYSVSPVGFWDWVPVAGTDNMNITVTLPNLSSVGGYSSPSTIRLVGFNTATGQWELLGNTPASGNTAGSTLSGSTNNIAGRNMSSYSALGIGSINQTPLPLTLTAFKATLQEHCEALISWNATNQQSIERFIVQHATDGSTFSDIGEVAAHASDEAYSFRYSGLAKGANYFRLAVRTPGGKREYSQTLRLTAACDLAAVSCWPNPANDLLQVGGLHTGDFIKIVDAAGKVQYSAIADGSGHTLQVKGWTAGSYIISVYAGNQLIAAKQMVIGTVR